MKQNFYTLIFIISIGQLFASASVNAQSAEEYAKKAIEQQDSFNHSAALYYIDSAIIINPNIDSFWTIRAYNMLAYGGGRDKVVKACDKAIAINDTNAYAYLLKGIAISEIPIPDEERDELLNDAYISSTGEFDSASWSKISKNYKREYSDKGFGNWYNSGEAINNLNKAIQLKPDYAYAYFWIAHILIDQYMYLNEQMPVLKEILYCLDTCIALDPENASYYLERGLLYKQLDKSQLALSDLNAAIEIDPMNPIYYVNRGYLKKEQLDDIKGACDDFRLGALYGIYVPDYYFELCK